MEIKITEYVICQQEAFFIIEILQHIYNEQQTLSLLIHFYYSQFMKTFSRSFSCFLIHTESFF